MRDRMCLWRGINIVREKFRVKNHKLGLMLLYSNIYEPLYSTDDIHSVFHKHNASNFTNVSKFCIGNLLKLSRIGICESKLLEMSIF